MGTSRKHRRSLAFMLALGIVIYGILSISIGIATADRCGEYSSAKSWSFVPPGWVCH